jgi:hypothetical protein
MPTTVMLGRGSPPRPGGSQPLLAPYSREARDLADRSSRERSKDRKPGGQQAVSGYWHTRATLAGYCRVRSYLVGARGHGIRAIDAIHAALAGQPWLPVPVTT